MRKSKVIVSKNIFSKRVIQESALNPRKLFADIRRGKDKRKEREITFIQIQCFQILNILIDHVAQNKNLQ